MGLAKFSSIRLKNIIKQFVNIAHMDEMPEKDDLDEIKSGFDKAPERPLILHAEDDTLNLILTRTIFKKQYPEYRILQAENGLEAIELFRQHSIHLILMDINMPEKNGIEASEEIRAMEAQSEQHTPIIALTGMNISDIEKQCLNVGIDDFLSKPVSRDKLEEIIKKYLKPDAQ